MIFHRHRDTDELTERTETLKRQEPGVSFGRAYFNSFMENNISRAAAALSYYLMFSIFPFLIMISLILGSLQINVGRLEETMDQMFPDAAADLIVSYLTYASAHRSWALLAASLILIITSASAALRIMIKTSREVYGLKSALPWEATAASFFMPLIVLLGVYLSGVLMLMGRWFFRWLEKVFHLSSSIVDLAWLRYPVIFLILFAMLVLIYRFSLPRTRIVFPVIPGAFGASFCLVLISFLFSYVFGISTRYSIVYGSLAAMMFLMFWFYVISHVIFLGCILNFLLYQRRVLKAGKDPEEAVRQADAGRHLKGLF